jgi:hypothetical protein
MKNIALLTPKSRFNEFTQSMLAVISEFGHAQVVSRDGSVFTVTMIQVTADNDCPFKANTPEHGMLLWNADGSSITSKDFDLIEF